MKKISKITILIALSVLPGIFAACSGKDAGDFTAKTAGAWQRNGNLQDERLEVLDDGTWTNRSLTDGVWTTTAHGTIAYNKDYKTFEFSDDLSNKIYPVEYSDSNGEVLNFRDNFYRTEHSVDGFAAFDGKWYKNADNDSDYYSFENGEWKWFNAEGMGHVSVDYGELAWDGAAGKLLAYSYTDGEVFAAFVPSDSGELMLDDVYYIFMEQFISDEMNGDEEGKNIYGEFPIIIEEFYYLDGDRDQPSFYFYENGQVDYDDGYGGGLLETVYIINDDEILIKTPDGTVLATLGIFDRSILLDDSGEDFYTIATN